MTVSALDRWGNAPGTQAARLNELLALPGHHTVDDLYQRLVSEFPTTTRGRVHGHIKYLRKQNAKLSEYKEGGLLHIRLDG